MDPRWFARRFPEAVTISPYEQMRREMMRWAGIDRDSGGIDPILGELVWGPAKDLSASQPLDVDAIREVYGDAMTRWHAEWSTPIPTNRPI
jgi:hypothetical protein